MPVAAGRLDPVTYWRRSHHVPMRADIQFGSSSATVIDLPSAAHPRLECAASRPGFCDESAAAASEIAARLGRVSGLVPRARATGADPLRLLCAGPRRQALARLPAHRRERLVPPGL